MKFYACGLAASRLALVFALAISTGAAAASEIRFIAPAGQELPASLTAEKLFDYQDYVLYRADRERFSSWQRSMDVPDGVRVLHDADRLLLGRWAFDTRAGIPQPPPGWSRLRESEEGRALSVVQFIGPIRQAWLEEIERLGAQPVHYVANNGYLVWADAPARAQLAALAERRSSLQFSALFQPFFKLGPVLDGQHRKAVGGDQIVPVRIQMVRHAQQHVTADQIDALAVRRIADWSPVLGFRNARFQVRMGDIQRIAEMPDVYWIERDMPRELGDEVQNQVLAADLVPDNSEPLGPGYLAFLGGLGFATDPTQYPVVVIVDDGVGDGTTDTGDPTLHESGQAGNPSRVSFNTDCTSAGSAQSVGGHGHINTSIVGGFDERAGFPFRDPDGFQRGQGVNPYTRLAGTRVFSPGFSQANCGNSDTGLIQHTWQQGAQISTNSWGCSGCAGSYDDSSQAFDAGIRDADPSAAGNQELLHLFAAGNSGSASGTVGTPGNGKNMLTVGASENARPDDEDGNWTDGCAIGPTGADNVMDVIGFSSRGPAPGNRVKPETIAPGTHIQGTASTSANFNGSSVCDEFRPSGQSVFAASSGTSHSTPAVAGLASLTWWWLENAPGVLPAESAVIGTPSPALIKAYILAHPTYLTGVSANDTLPSNVQGYGMPDMSQMFDDALKVVVNQDVVFDASGESWELIVSAGDPTRPVRVMMAYTDQPGAVGTSPQVNDLDLVVDAGGQQYLGNVFSDQWSTTGGSADSQNNYEAVFLQPGTASALTITVSAFNIAGDGVPEFGDGTDQDFALVCYNCAQEPTFTLVSDPTDVQVCTPEDAVYDLDVGSVLGFAEPVTLTLNDAPAGASVSLSTNPVTPPAASTLTLGGTDQVGAGSFAMTLAGEADGELRELVLDLDVFTDAAGAGQLTTPADGATNVSQQPLLEWSAGTQVQDYLVEISTDEDFADVIFEATTGETSLQVGEPLPSNSVLYWRVSASNQCGGSVSQASSFTTEALPGDCSIGSEAAVHFFDDVESGQGDWIIGGNASTWQIQSADTHSGSAAWNAEDTPSVSDQWLISPPIEIPASNSAPTLQFWNRQVIEDGGAGCFDGAMIEISTDGGQNWLSVDPESLLTDTYDGPIDDGFSNPASGLLAWCGDPQDWLNSVVDLGAFAGETVQFRFRMATDSSVGRDGWFVDDFRVQSCATDFIFADGFED